MKYVRAELQRFTQKFLRKMNVSAELKAAKTDPIHIEVDEQRIRQNYLKMIPASLLLVFVSLCGMLYHLFLGTDALQKSIFVAVFTLLSPLSIRSLSNKRLP